MERLEETQTELEKRDQRARGVRGAHADPHAPPATRSRAASATRSPRCERERAAAAAGLPDDLMALYEKLREQKNGVGAAALPAASAAAAGSP